MVTGRRYGDGMDIATRVRHGWRSIDRRFLDAGVAVVLFGFMVFELDANKVVNGENASSALAYLLAAVITLPFAVHRRHPVTVLAILSHLASAIPGPRRSQLLSAPVGAPTMIDPATDAAF